MPHTGHDPWDTEDEDLARKVRQGPLRRGLFLLPALIPGLVLGWAIGFTIWITLILVYFGDSSEYWPGFACAVPGVLVGGLVLGIVTWGTYQLLAYVSGHGQAPYLPAEEGNRPTPVRTRRQPREMPRGGANDRGYRGAKEDYSSE